MYLEAMVGKFVGCEGMVSPNGKTCDKPGFNGNFKGESEGGGGMQCGQKKTSWGEP